MAEYSNVQNRSSMGWIIAAAIAVVVVLFLVISAGMSPTGTDDTGVHPEAIAPAGGDAAPAASDDTLPATGGTTAPAASD